MSDNLYDLNGVSDLFDLINQVDNPDIIDKTDKTDKTENKIESKVESKIDNKTDDDKPNKSKTSQMSSSPLIGMPIDDYLVKFIKLKAISHFAQYIIAKYVATTNFIISGSFCRLILFDSNTTTGKFLSTKTLHKYLQSSNMIPQNINIISDKLTFSNTKLYNGWKLIDKKKKAHTTIYKFYHTLVEEECFVEISTTTQYMQQKVFFDVDLLLYDIRKGFTLHEEVNGKLVYQQHEINRRHNRLYDVIAKIKHRVATPILPLVSGPDNEAERQLYIKNFILKIRQRFSIPTWDSQHKSMIKNTNCELCFETKDGLFYELPCVNLNRYICLICFWRLIEASIVNFTYFKCPFCSVVINILTLPIANKSDEPVLCESDQEDVE